MDSLREFELVSVCPQICVSVFIFGYREFCCQLAAVHLTAVMIRLRNYLLHPLTHYIGLALRIFLRGTKIIACQHFITTSSST